MLESLFRKVANLKASNFIGKRLKHRCFPVKLAVFLRTPILKNIYERLLLWTSNIQSQPFGKHKPTGKNGNGFIHLFETILSTFDNLQQIRKTKYDEITRIDNS